VVLNHCDYIASVTASSCALTVKFNNVDAFTAASNSRKGGIDLFLIVHTPGCGRYDQGEHCNFLVLDVHVDASSLTITVKGVDTSLVDAITDYLIDWGQFTNQPYPSFIGGGDNTGNSTIGNSTGCVPPKDTKYGLPTACLGDDFDMTLDDQLGYTAESATDWYGLSPVLGEVSSDDDWEGVTNSADLLTKRLEIWDTAKAKVKQKL
jgi:hypothetical protein